MDETAKEERKRKRASRFKDAEPAPAVLPGILPGLPGMPGIPGLSNLSALPGLPTTGGAMDDKTFKSLTELFLGNLPLDVDAATLKEFLNAAMTETKLSTSPGPAITDLRYNVGSKFAFIVLRSPEECTNALCLTGIPYMNSFLKIERPGTFMGAKTGTMTWQQLTGAGGAPPAPSPSDSIGGGSSGGASAANALVLATMLGGTTAAVDPMTKPLRELFIGNVVEGTPPSEIQDFLGAVMAEVGLVDGSLGEGNPILNVRTNGKFAFVELRSVDETNNALNMDGIPFQGMELRVKRPEKYSGNPTPSVTWREFMEIRTEVDSKGSSVLVVGNAIRPGEVEASDDSWRAVCTDLREELGKGHGHAVVDLVVPRPADSAMPPASFDYSGGQVAADNKGVGKCFVRFASAAAAEEAMKEIAKKCFDGKDLKVDVFDESRFSSRDFSGV